LAALTLASLSFAEEEKAAESVKAEEVELVKEESDDDGWWVHGMLWNVFESGYVTSSGTLWDTKPVSMQNLDWDIGLGDYGHIWGYGCFLGTLHNEQKQFHRAAFNEFEGGAFYGYDIKLCDGLMLCNSAGGIWNPLIGYYKPYDDTGWQYRCFQSLENEYLTPFWDILGGIKPSQWNRIRFGVRRSFFVTDYLVLTPMLEGVWVDSSRFHNSFNSAIDSGKFLNGVFQSMTATLKLEWLIDDNWSTWVVIREYVLIDSQARHQMDNDPALTQYYWNQTDRAIFSWGVGYSF